MNLAITEIRTPSEKEKMNALLEKSGLKTDALLDYSAGIVDEDYRLLATGSCAGNTLRCFAVEEAFRGEGLLNMLLSHLLEKQAMRGNTHCFVYTKRESAAFFQAAGFYEIAETGRMVFMENRRNAFSNFISSISANGTNPSSAVVMNANPFTLGHRHLVEQAAASGDTHIFILSEERSAFPYSVRMRLAKEACSDLSRVYFHPSSDYIISSATFPAYFLRTDDDLTAIQAELDASVFIRIAEAVNIRRRFFGSEPYSASTETYNRTMARLLPPNGIECVILDRYEVNGTAISAGNVRTLFAEGDMDALRPLVPDSTYAFLLSDEADAIRRRILIPI